MFLKGAQSPKPEVFFCFKTHESSLLIGNTWWFSLVKPLLASCSQTESLFPHVLPTMRASRLTASSRFINSAVCEESTVCEWQRFSMSHHNKLLLSSQSEILPCRQYSPTFYLPCKKRKRKICSHKIQAAWFNCPNIPSLFISHFIPLTLVLLTLQLHVCFFYCSSFH